MDQPHHVLAVTDVLAAVIRPPAPVAFADAAAWWADHLEALRGVDQPVDAAILGATRVDRLGYAFAGGYAAALRAMVPTLPERTLASFAATEKGGAHPRAIETTLSSDGTLTGRKSWVTLGPEGGVILVVARLDEPGDRPALRVVRVDAKAPGVSITPLPHAPIVPEIPHASVTLDRVRIAPDDVLPGDGYDRYLKPFRTIEDVHVHAAVLAWLLAIGARAGWPRAVRERGLAALVTARSLAAMDPTSPAVHLALGGLIAEARGIVAELDWSGVDAELRGRWERDRPLLDVAGKARAQRLEAAWDRIG